MKRGIKVPGIVTIAVLTLITVVFWVGFEVYHTLNSKPDINVSDSVLAPLNTNIDVSVLDKIRQRTAPNPAPTQ